MPNVLKWRGYRFFFFSDEGNEPPHIHIAKDDCAAKFWLSDCSLVYNDNFKHNQIKIIEGVVRKNQAFFLEEWYEHERRKY